MEKSAIYEKISSITSTQIKHIIRIELNSTKAQLEEALKFVPSSAIVSMVIDDSISGGDAYGEIVFTEEYNLY